MKKKTETKQETTATTPVEVLEQEIKMGNENTNIDENKTNNEYNEC